MATATKTRRTKTATAKPERNIRGRKPKAPAIYAGAPIPGLRVYRRDMPEFKKCKAECWLLIAETTYTFANTYNDQLKASFDAKHYTYALNDKSRRKIDKKLEVDFVEVEVTEWPAWITNAAATKRTRRAK
jgi:hypothetical protein